MKIYLLILWFLIYPLAAHAYLDPATGSIFLGMLSAIMSLVIILFEKIKKVIFNLFFGTLKKKRSLKSQPEILIHCENASYIPVFSPLLEEFNRKNVKAKLFCTTDAEAQHFSQFKNTEVSVFEPQEIFRKIVKSKAELFMSTTPGLDVLGLKKSALFKNSAHIIHSPSDMHTYALFSFDQYDSILFAGGYQTRSLCRLERLRGNSGSRSKKIFTPGLLYYDYFLKNKSNDKGAYANGDTLLIAPTWGKTSLIYYLDEESLSGLARTYERVSIRFHPQSKISDAEKRSEIIELIKKWPNISVDQHSSSFGAIMESTAMLTDISGIMLDFKVLKPKGIFYFFSSHFKFDDKEGHWLKWEPYEMTFAKKWGVQITDAQQLQNLKALATPRLDLSELDIGMNNIGNCAHASVVAIQTIMEQLRAGEK